MNSIKAFWIGLSTTGKAILIAIVVVLIFIIYNYFKNSGAGTNNNPAQGQYYVIRNDIDIPPTVNNITTPPITVNVPAPGGQQPPPTNNPPPTPTTTKSGARVRAKNSQSNVTAWDAKFNGVPLRASPTGTAHVQKLLPFGSNVNLQSASPVIGQSNIPGDRAGNTLWYKVGNGYVSSYDLVF